MELSDYIQVGMTNEETFRVEEQQTAAHVGSGALRVLATSSMIGFMESVSHRLLAQRLPQGYSSVGVMVEVRHLAPTPMGEQVRVRSEVVGIEGSRVEFTIQAWDAQEKIGEGRHQRAVIEQARFLRRVEAKMGGKPAA